MQQGQRAIKSRGRRADEVRELRAEAAEARQLAGTFTVVRDLLNYASALEQEARLETQNNTVRNGRSYVDS